MNRNGSTLAWKNNFDELVRNRYYYGKMMDVYSFELETNYFLSVQRMLNRLVTGYGVICGLDVIKVKKENCIRISSGAAIDCLGRLVIVPETSRALAIPEHLLPGQKSRQVIQEKIARDECQSYEECIHVGLCYHECDSDPSPVLSGDCEGWGSCEAGAVRERYRVEFHAGEAKRPTMGDTQLEDLVSRGRINYKELATWVTKECPTPQRDCCVPLANICLSLEDDKFVFTQDDIDITIRPIVYSNVLLRDLLNALLSEGMGYSQGK